MRESASYLSDYSKQARRKDTRRMGRVEITMMHITDKQKKMLGVVLKYGRINIGLAEMIDDDFNELVHNDLLLIRKSYDTVEVTIMPIKLNDVKDMINV